MFFEITMRIVNHNSPVPAAMASDGSSVVDHSWCWKTRGSEEAVMVSTVLLVSYYHNGAKKRNSYIVDRQFSLELGNYQREEHYYYKLKRGVKLNFLFLF